MHGCRIIIPYTTSKMALKYFLFLIWEIANCEKKCANKVCHVQICKHHRRQQTSITINQFNNIAAQAGCRCVSPVYSPCHRRRRCISWKSKNVRIIQTLSHWFQFSKRANVYAHKTQHTRTEFVELFIYWCFPQWICLRVLCWSVRVSLCAHKKSKIVKNARKKHSHLLSIFF